MLIDKYIGIPFEDKGASFDGADCFGLVRLFYKTEFGFNIPDPEQTAFNSKGIFDKYIEETAKNWSVAKIPKIYDVVAIADDPKLPNIIQHFGILLPNNKMLHIKDKISSHIVDIDKYKYYIKGFHRWQNS